MPQVIKVLRLTGEDCFHLKVIVPTPADLESIVDAVARYGSVTTAIVLRSAAAQTDRARASDERLASEIPKFRKLCCKVIAPRTRFT